MPQRAHLFLDRGDQAGASPLQREHAQRRLPAARLERAAAHRQYPRGAGAFPRRASGRRLRLPVAQDAAGQDSGLPFPRRARARPRGGLPDPRPGVPTVPGGRDQRHQLGGHRPQGRPQPARSRRRAPQRRTHRSGAGLLRGDRLLRPVRPRDLLSDGLYARPPRRARSGAGYLPKGALPRPVQLDRGGGERPLVYAPKGRRPRKARAAPGHRGPALRALALAGHEAGLRGDGTGDHRPRGG